MYEKQLPPLPSQSARNQMSPPTVVALSQPPSRRNRLGHISQQAQPRSDIFASLEQAILKLRGENDALRRSIVEKEAKIEMLQKLTSQHSQRMDERTRQTAQLFQAIHSALKTYRDNTKDQAKHLPKGSPEEIVPITPTCAFYDHV
ncbi:hypothetical protein FocnCong_v012767 [Fusarium oxysporum f. sp. conglutinans]|nr:hypothetical protein FocnCong_v012767 [Fusarium oxysporum f. sp. conglutinans]